MIATVESVRPDVGIHLATHSVAEHQPAAIVSLASSNIGFPVRLVEALAGAGCRSLINASTAWQHVCRPAYRSRSLYVATKQASEDILPYCTDSALLQVCTLILFDTYGPGDRRQKFVPALAHTVRTGHKMNTGSGEQQPRSRRLRRQRGRGSSCCRSRSPVDERGPVVQCLVRSTGSGTFTRRALRLRCRQQGRCLVGLAPSSTQ
jgi:hypothetical protein